MKELEKNELMKIEGGEGIGKVIKKWGWVGGLLWVEENWSEIKQGCYDGWNECHSSDKVDAVSHA